MSDDFTPQTDPYGDLTPPPRVPPTAVAASPAPDAPEPRRSSALARFEAGLPPRRRGDTYIGWTVDRALDALDDVGDAIAAAVGLR